MLTQARLKELLHYDPLTGIFTWKVSRGGQVAGSIAGSYDVYGYLQTQIDGKTHKAHRLVWLYMTGAFPQGKEEIDHIHGIRDDNRWSQLRLVSGTQIQAQNQKIRITNTSGVLGVGWSKRSKKWQAHITVNRKYRHLGFYDCFIDAVAARMRANKKYGFHDNHGQR